MGRGTQPSRPRCDENPGGLSPEEATIDLTGQMAFGLNLEEGAEFAPRAGSRGRKGVPGRGNSLCKGTAAGLLSASLLGNLRLAPTVVPDDVASARPQTYWYLVDKQQCGILGKLQGGSYLEPKMP